MLHVDSSPFIIPFLKMLSFPSSSGSQGCFKFSKVIYAWACRNKIPLSYLETLDDAEKHQLPFYAYHRHRFQRILEIVGEVSELLDENCIDYVVFKTLKPYPEDAADVDILIMDPCTDYHKVAKMLGRKFRLIDKGPYNTTMYDHKEIYIPKGVYDYNSNIMVDVHSEISVNRVIYVDKHFSQGYIRRARVPSGYMTRTFTPEVDLLTTMAHSVIKENVYTLAEYITTLSYFAEVDDDSIKNLVYFAKKNKLTKAITLHLTTTLLLYKVAYSIPHRSIIKVISALGGSALEPSQIIDIGTPYSFGWLSLFHVFLEKIGDPVFRKCLKQLPIILFDRKFQDGFLRRTSNKLRKM